jgi:hypothetical protein
MEHTDEEELKKQILDQYNKLTPIGGLFDSVIQYTTYEDLDNFISNLNKEQALYSLIEAVRYAHKKGVFNLEESELISKSIRKISFLN